MPIPASILLVSMKYSYGNPKLGLSYDWMHLCQGLPDYFSRVEAFDYMGILADHGKELMQEMLVEHVASMRPDVVVFALFTDQFDPECVRRVRERAKTLCFFMDDSWRRDYVRFWAPHFDAFTTVRPRGELYYKSEGLPNVVQLPFGVNEAVFHPMPEVDRLYDVSFIGGWHPYRQWLLSFIEKRSGIRVKAFGHGWPDGVLDTERLVRVFNASKISLNMSNSETWDARYVFSSLRAVRSRIMSKKFGEQIKGRHFEIPACRALQFTHYADGLSDFYDLSNELVVYTSPEDLTEKLQYYLANEAELEALAAAGTERTLREHTYGSRFIDAFRRLNWI